MQIQYRYICMEIHSREDNLIFLSTPTSAEKWLTAVMIALGPIVTYCVCMVCWLTQWKKWCCKFYLSVVQCDAQSSFGGSYWLSSLRKWCTKNKTDGVVIVSSGFQVCSRLEWKENGNQTRAARPSSAFQKGRKWDCVDFSDAPNGVTRWVTLCIGDPLYGYI